MPPTDDHLSDEERLRIQNELTRAELESALGAQFGQVEGDLPPEVEAEFLSRIKAMESGGREGYVPIGSLLMPNVLNEAAAKANGGDVEGAAAHLESAALQAGVLTEAPEWISPEHWYFFLAHDFLEHTVPPPPPHEEGADEELRHVVAVLYEHVRQDGPEFLARVTEGFLQDLLHPDRPFLGEYLAHTCRDGADVVTREVATTKIRAWKEQWAEIVPVGFGLGGIVEEAIEQGTYVQFGCAYTATDRAGTVREFDGPGVMQLAFEDKGFKVVGCAMEGFEM